MNVASEVTHRLKCHIKLSLWKWWILQCFKKKIILAFSTPLPFFDHNEDKVLLWQLKYSVLSIFVRPSTMKLLVHGKEENQKLKRRKKNAYYIC